VMWRGLTAFDRTTGRALCVIDGEQNAGDACIAAGSGLVG